MKKLHLPGCFARSRVHGCTARHYGGGYLKEERSARRGGLSALDSEEPASESEGLTLDIGPEPFSLEGRRGTVPSQARGTFLEVILLFAETGSHPPEGPRAAGI